MAEDELYLRTYPNEFELYSLVHLSERSLQWRLKNL
jgi:hypothetical protein